MKVRIEVCPNDGRQSPLKVMVVSANEDAGTLAHKAAKKLGLGTKGSSSARMWDVLDGGEAVGPWRDGARYCVAFHGEAFVDVGKKRPAGGGGGGGGVVASPACLSEFVAEESVVRLIEDSPPEGAGQRLRDAGFDVLKAVKALGQPRAERPTHVWWTPQFQSAHNFYVRPEFRSALVQLNACCADSQLVEMRVAPFQMHLDLDVCVDDRTHVLYGKSINQFWQLCLDDVCRAMGIHRVVAVTGCAGELRQAWKLGLHVYGHTLCASEEQWVEEVRKFRSTLRDLNPTWAHGLDYEAMVDEMTGGGMRLLGSSRVVTCKKCRKSKKVNPLCTVCFGLGMEPARKHALLFGTINDCSIYSLSSSSSSLLSLSSGGE